MGTRADFYLGHESEAKWLGSIAWDGHPKGGPKAVCAAKTVEEYLAAVKELGARDDFTKPEQGWPWPWETSSTTDWAYRWHDGKISASCFGSRWLSGSDIEELDLNAESETEDIGERPAFPNMKHLQSVTLGARSGIILFGG